MKPTDYIKSVAHRSLNFRSTPILPPQLRSKDGFKALPPKANS